MARCNLLATGARAYGRPPRAAGASPRRRPPPMHRGLPRTATTSPVPMPCGLESRRARPPSRLVGPAGRPQLLRRTQPGSAGGARRTFSVRLATRGAPRGPCSATHPPAPLEAPRARRLHPPEPLGRNFEGARWRRGAGGSSTATTGATTRRRGPPCASSARASSATTASSTRWTVAPEPTRGALTSSRRTACRGRGRVVGRDRDRSGAWSGPRGWCVSLLLLCVLYLSADHKKSKP